MKSGKIKLFVFAAILVFSAASCKKDETEELQEQEMQTLEQYLLKNKISTEPTIEGLYYIPSVIGTGDSAVKNTWVEISYTGRILSNNQIVFTSNEQIAKENNLFVSGIYYGPARVILGNLSINGLNLGISLMREGGKARLIIPSDLGLGGQSNGTIPSYSSLIFDVELIKVIKNTEEYEGGLLKSYLESNGFSSDSTQSGIYIKNSTEGDGELPVTGNTVTVTYTGKFLNGKVFDSGTFSLKIGAKQVIPGFESGVKLIKKEGSATIVIPYYNAYGLKGIIDAYYRTVVPPFSTLVFDLKVTNIVK